MERSFVQLLEAVIDEVEGFRQTDPASHLPPTLMREIREAVECVGSAGAGRQLNELEDMRDRLVKAVITGDVKGGQALILFDDGSFIVLDADSYEPDTADLVVRRRGTGESNLAHYLNPRDQASVGLISESRAKQLENEERAKLAKQKIVRLKSQLAEVEAVLHEVESARAAAL